MSTLRDVPFPVSIEAHHPVKSRTRKKEKIQWSMGHVKSIPDGSKVGISLLRSFLQLLSLFFQIRSNALRRDFTIFHALVKTKNMGIRIVQRCLPKPGVKRHDTRPQKRVNLLSADLGNKGLNPRDEIGFNPLALNRRNNESH